MESPDMWRLITACLAVSDLHQTEETWAFLVAAQLVEDRPEHRAFFVEAVRLEVDRVITGPSSSWRVASHLGGSAGLLRPAALGPDPGAATAKAWRARFDRGQPILHGGG